MEEYEALIKLVESAREDVAKAQGGNKAAGTRVRKTMQDVKNSAQEVRKRILETPGKASTGPRGARQSASATGPDARSFVAGDAGTSPRRNDTADGARAAATLWAHGGCGPILCHSSSTMTPHRLRRNS